MSWKLWGRPLEAAVVPGAAPSSSTSSGLLLLPAFGWRRHVVVVALQPLTDRFDVAVVGGRDDPLRTRRLTPIALQSPVPVAPVYPFGGGGCGNGGTRRR